MRAPLWPNRIALRVLAGVPVVALVVAAVQRSVDSGLHFAAGALAVALAWVVVDAVRSALAWHGAPLRWERRLPAALALGVPHTLACALVNEGDNDWWVEVLDRADAAIEMHGLPLSVYVPAHSRIELHYTIVARQRGEASFQKAELRVRTLHGSFHWRGRSGEASRVRVYPDYTLLARYDRLEREHRLHEAGIARRGWEGAAPDGMPLWLLVDCGARPPPAKGSPLDSALNAAMLLAHVALASGEPVGALSFGGSREARRRIAPARGAGALHRLVGMLHDVQPHAGPAGAVEAAHELLRWRGPSSRVVLLAGDRNADDIAAAAKLLRTRHRVLVAEAGGAMALVERYRAWRATRRA